MDIQMTLFGQMMAVWLVFFWATFAAFRYRRGVSAGQVLFALLVQFVPPLGILYLGFLAYFDLRQKEVAT